jgi:GT2 family glycosyltransferase
MMPGARVATVLVNYRTPADTIRAVSGLRRSTCLDQRVIVCDNAAADDDHRALRDALGEGVECVATGGNLGYAGGNNVGIRLALAGRAEFVWLLNPDAEVGPDTLTDLLATADAIGDAGVLGPRILYPDGERVWSDGGVIDDATFGATSHRNTGKRATHQHKGTPHDVDYVTGAALLIRRAVFEHVGLLPEQYFLYFEETAFCRDVRAAGWRTMVDARTAVVHHKRSSGTVVTPYYLYYMTRNRLHFARTYYGVDADAVLPGFRATFLDGWRGRVEAAAPAWLATFDEIVDRAVRDAEAGVFGAVDGMDRYPVAVGAEGGE